ncbi:MAG: hypothetical protein CVU19_01680 [Betaproteobacteria bacterium HGW-Betaproteobacteria-13]|nr:MAG: hypothetical protein CVU25_05615 [Betaproteobacteria bacterium HGW-Betaproteobacteria-19]PKO82454.1 MAG: hypothetical protein CVU19_01680 [Betaproteobacteria bacterium HGW-Betaproteobacteria-13]
MTDNNAEAAYQAGLKARIEGNAEAALSHLRAAIKLSPSSASYHFALGDALHLAGNNREAARAYETGLRLDPNSCQGRNNLAVVYSQEHRYVEAESILQELLQRDQGQTETWLNLCSVVQNLEFREADSVTYARKAVALAPRNAQAYRFLATALLRQGSQVEALEVLETAASIDPRNADVHYGLGICHMQSNRVGEAIESFQMALAIEPNHGKTYFALAEFLFRLEEFVAAEEACQRALDLSSDRIAPGMLMARILFALERFEEARAFQIRARALENHLLRARKGTPIPDNEFILLPVHSVARWCAENGAACREVLPELEWHARTPIVLGIAALDRTPSPASVPSAYVAEIEDAVVLPGHEVLMVNQNRTALYNRLVQMKDWYSLREDRIVPLIANQNILVECGPRAPKRIPKGIFMFSEGWSNYAHWLIEQLPRLHLIEQFPEYDGIPLLLNEGLYPQQLESLQLVSRDRYPIQILANAQRHLVKKLVYPTNLAAFVKRRYRPDECANTADGPFHPEAIEFLRERILPGSKNVAKPSKRLWISRKAQIRAGQRRLINEAEIEAHFLARGFETIVPEQLSFRAQVDAFSNAEMIAGPAGAAMINIVFAPPGAKILILTKDHPQVNFHYFTNIGQIVGFDVAHLCGQAIENFGVHGFETDFVIEMDQVRHAVRDFLRI